MEIPRSSRGMTGGDWDDNGRSKQVKSIRLSRRAAVKSGVMFDEELPKKTVSEFPRDLEQLSVAELRDYVAELEAEIVRVKADIDSKEASKNAADSFFKS